MSLQVLYFSPSESSSQFTVLLTIFSFVVSVRSDFMPSFFPHVQIPFGIAQIGKAFRNEITPRNFIFRSREFEQMEIEYFIEPQDDVWPKV